MQAPTILGMLRAILRLLIQLLLLTLLLAAALGSSPAYAVIIVLFGLVYLWAQFSSRRRIDPQVQQAIQDYRDRLNQMPIDEARSQALPLFMKRRADFLDATSTSRSLLGHFDLPTSIRELFEQYRSMEWNLAVISTDDLGPSDFRPGYIRIGFIQAFDIGAADDGELVIWPGRDEIFEFYSRHKRPDFDERPFPSIYHWFLFQDHDVVCPNCGYDLRATPDRCPECGKMIREP